jgi:hypothetical protein
MDGSIHASLPCIAGKLNALRWHALAPVKNCYLLLPHLVFTKPLLCNLNLKSDKQPAPKRVFAKPNKKSNWKQLDLRKTKAALQSYSAALMTM